MYNFSSYSVYNLQLNMVEFDLQIYNFRTNLNVHSTATVFCSADGKKGFSYVSIKISNHLKSSLSFHLPFL